MLLRACDRFLLAHGRFPGALDGGGADADVAGLKAAAAALLAEACAGGGSGGGAGGAAVADDYAVEMCR